MLHDISLLKSLAALEVSCLLGVSRVSSKESRNKSLLLDWCQMFSIVIDMLGEISVQIFKLLNREGEIPNLNRRQRDSAYTPKNLFSKS